MDFEFAGMPIGWTVSESLVRTEEIERSSDDKDDVNINVLKTEIR